MVKDLGSQNGTWMGEERLHPNVPRKLHDGDVVGFGVAPATAPPLMQKLGAKVRHLPARMRPAVVLRSACCRGPCTSCRKGVERRGIWMLVHARTCEQ